MKSGDIILANTEELCMGCMRIIGDIEQCPHCGFKKDSKQSEMYLPIRTTIGGRYLVGAAIDHNGDGTSYMGWDLSAQIPVVIREYMPDSISIRAENRYDIIVKKGEEQTYITLMTEYIRLWSHLLDISRYSAMIDVYDIVEENNTVYAIHEYVDGITLREFLLRTPTGYISWEKARSLFMPVLSTIGNLHAAGIVHRGISPVTLVLDSNGKLRVTGFSIAEARTVRSPLEPQLFPGYAAIEQYSMDDQQGPWTDVYAFAAVLYRALIGSDPIDAKSRITNDRLMIPGRFAEQIPAYVINGLINALQILPEARTQTVEQCRAELSAAPSATVSIEDDELFNQNSYSQRNDPIDSDNGMTIIAGEDDFPDANEKLNPTSFTSISEEQSSEQLDLSSLYQPTESKKNKGSSVATQVLIGAIGVLVAISLLLFVFTKVGIIDFNFGEETTQPSDVYDYVEVPNFEGRSYDTIKSSSEFTKHFVFSITYDYSDTVEDGYIISQDIAPYSKVTSGTVIKITVSKGIEQIQLVNVEGMTYDEAVKLLTDKGFDVEKDTRVQENDGSHIANTVYKMSPSTTTGRTYDKGTKVILTVWDEEETTTAAPIYIPEVTTVVTEEETVDEN